MNEFKFTTRNGEELKGELVYHYDAFEGSTRYIFEVNNEQYRCVLDSNGNFVEYVA